MSEKSTLAKSSEGTASTALSKTKRQPVGVLQRIRNLVHNTKGAEMVEMIVIVAIVITLVYLGMQKFGSQVSDALDKQGKAVDSIATN